LSKLRPYHPAVDLARNGRTARKWLVSLLAGGFYGVVWALSLPDFVLLALIPLLLLALLVIWTLPASANPPARALELSFFAFFIALILWPNYLALSLPGLPWITLGRIIATPMVLLLLICLSVSPDFRNTIAETLRSSRAIWILFAAFVVIQFLSIGLSRDMPNSVQKFVVAQLYWTAILIVGIYVFQKPGRILLWSVLLCAMLIPLGVTGLIELSREQVPWANSIPSFLVIDDESVLRILQGKSRSATGEYRVQSTFNTSLTYAEYMAFTVPFLLHFMMASFRFPVRLVAAGLLVFTFYMILATDSRLGAVGFFMSILVYVFFWAWRAWRRDRKALIAPAIIVGYPAGLVLFILSTFYSGRLRNLIWGSGEHQASNEARVEQYQEGLELLSRNPFGYGVGQGAVTLNHQNLAGVVTIDTYYISIALEYGVIGFLIYYGMLLASIYKGSAVALADRSADPNRGYAAPLVTALSVFVVIKSILSLEENHAIVFMMLAMLLVIIHKARPDSEIAAERDSRRRNEARRYRRPLLAARKLS
jgi:hypothetical protein